MQPQLKHNPELAARVEHLERSLKSLLAGGQRAQPGHGRGLEVANTGLSSALRVVESGDRAIPAQAMQLYQQSRAEMKEYLQRWESLKSTEVQQLNEQLRRGGMKPLQLSQIEAEVFYQMTR